MTGRDLYEKWLEFAGDWAVRPDFEGARSAWSDLDFNEARAWDDLADFIETAEMPEATA